MTALPKVQPKMPEPPLCFLGNEGVLKPDCKWSDAVNYGQAMYEYGRQQMREECLDIIDEVSDITIKQDMELSSAIRKLP